MPNRHGKRPEIPRHSDTHPKSSTQRQISGDAYRWPGQQAGGDAQQMGSDVPRGTPQTEQSSQASYSKRLQNMERQHKERIIQILQQQYSRPLDHNNPYAQQIFQDHTKQERITREQMSLDVERAQIAQASLPPEQPMQPWPEQPIPYGSEQPIPYRSEQPIPYGSEQPIPYESEPEMQQLWSAQQRQYNPEQVWQAQQQELTPEQLSQYTLEQQAQQEQYLLELMRQRQLPYPEYPGQGGSFQQ
jgi:hypothetical protein